MKKILEWINTRILDEETKKQTIFTSDSQKIQKAASHGGKSKALKDVKEYLIRFDEKHPFAEFNINDHVYVKLNEAGRKHFIEHRNFKHSSIQWEIPEDYITTQENLDKLTDKDGYTEFQLWDFMHIFGTVTFNGCKALFESTVKFKKEELN